MLNDVQKFFTTGFTSKYVMKSLLNISPYLKYVTTLPCEIFMSKNYHALRLIPANCGVRLSHSKIAEIRC